MTFPWQLVSCFDEIASRLKERGAKLVSTGVVVLSDGPLGATRSLVVRDPDGHALELVEEGRETAASARR